MGYDMSIRSDREVNDTALLTSLNTEWEAALKVRDAYPREAAGTKQEHEDPFKGFGGTWENADPGYAKAQAEVMRISEDIDKARVSYFRLNIWGMGRYRDTMEAVGMGHWTEDYPGWPEASGFGITNEILDMHRGYGEDDHRPLTADEIHACMKFEEEIEHVRSAHPGETPGIPLVKFTSNDGWHVTPVECRSALQLFGEFLVAGYQTLTWEEALIDYRNAPEDQRKVVASNALALNVIDNDPVGHAPFNPGDADDRASVLDVITEEYFLQWLRYLEIAAQHDGFEVY